MAYNVTRCTDEVGIRIARSGCETWPARVLRDALLLARAADALHRPAHQEPALQRRTA